MKAPTVQLQMSSPGCSHQRSSVQCCTGKVSDGPIRHHGLEGTERLIGLTKMTIKKTLGRAHFNLITLQTVVSKVEAMLNERPLTHISDDNTEPKPLTPAHLLKAY